MSSLAAYVAGGLAVVFAMDVVAPPIGADFIRNRLTAQPASFHARFDAATGPSLYEVNRVGKAPRLAPPRAATNIVPKEQQGVTPGSQRPTSDIVRDVDSERDKAAPGAAPFGCDPAYSTLSRAAPARFTGRCIA